MLRLTESLAQLSAAGNWTKGLCSRAPSRGFIMPPPDQRAALRAAPRPGHKRCELARILR